MPITRVKHHTMKNTKSKSMKSKISSNPQNMQHQHHHQNLIDLITMITQARKNKTKAQTNLPARLMRMSNMHKPQSYEKSVSSSYSSIMHNGEKHIKGKQIINNSTKPFIQINELQDGHIQHFMVPKDTIPYNKPTNITHIQTGMPLHMPIHQARMPLHMPMPMPMPFQMQMKIQSPKTSMNIYSTKIKKTKKNKKSKSKKSKSNKSKSKGLKKSKSKNTKKSKSKKSKKTKSKK